MGRLETKNPRQSLSPDFVFVLLPVCQKHALSKLSSSSHVPYRALLQQPITAQTTSKRGLTAHRSSPI